MLSTSEKLDKLLRQEQLKKRNILIMFSLLVLLAVSLYFGSGYIVDSRIVKGEIVGYGAIPSHSGDMPFVSIKLESGEQVRAQYHLDEAPKEGLKVKVLEGVNIFGIKSYSLISADKANNPKPLIRVIE